MVAYEFNSYFAAGKTRYWAEYVDKKENGGNNNGKVDGKEIQLFIDVIKHRYGYDYDFNKTDSEQSQDLVNIDNGKNSTVKTMYMDNRGLGGATSIGMEFSNRLSRYSDSNDYKKCKEVLEIINSFPVEAQKYNIIQAFLTGFTLGSAFNGLFEQMASEYGDAFNNEDIVPFMKTLMDNVPEEKRNTEEFKFLEQTYQEYSQKPADAKFENSKFSAISRVFRCDTLSKLDSAVKKLYDVDE
jgi:hypothetical protein